MAACTGKPERKLPNFVIFLADDLGYADVKWNNSKAYAETPNLDNLAQNGAVFTNCYSASSMCSPSRAGLLTGRAPTRIGIHDWIKEIYKKPFSNVHLPSEEITFAEVLKQKNYKTAIIGKWHLNNEFNTGNNSDPNNQGFDYWYCTPVQSNPSHKNPENYYDNGVSVGKIGTEDNPVFSCELIADQAITWINSLKKGSKFLLYLPFHEPHVVCDARKEIKQKYLDKIKEGYIPLLPGTGENGLGQAEYYACIENMDASIGHVLDMLEEGGFLENTLVIFSSDNGPDSNRRYKGRLQSVGETGELSGRKRWILEGGIRQATIMSWKGVLTPRTEIEASIGHVDFMPTICDIVNLTPPNDRVIDGISILPLLMGKEFSRGEKSLHWHFHAPRGGPQSALRDGDWVITARWDQSFSAGRFNTSEIRKIKKAELTGFKLYDIVADPGQIVDMKESYPEVYKVLKNRLVVVHSSVTHECPQAGQFQWTEKLQTIVDSRYDDLQE